MDFGGDIGLWQRKIAEGPEGTALRLAVFEALAIESGQAVLDLGCRGGHLVREVALAVGENGRVVGLEASADQMSSARALCSSADHSNRCLKLNPEQYALCFATLSSAVRGRCA